MEKWLNGWLIKYVVKDPSNASPQTKAEKPLSDAKVVVKEVPGNPGYYTAEILLRPHFQLEGLTAALQLVSAMPTGK